MSQRQRKNRRGEAARDTLVTRGDTDLVIASAAKQSTVVRVYSGLLRRPAPRNDAETPAEAGRVNVRAPIFPAISMTHF